MRKPKIFNLICLQEYLLNKYDVPYLQIKGQLIQIKHRFDLKWDVFIKMENDIFVLFENYQYTTFDSLAKLEEYLSKYLFITDKKHKQLFIEF